MVTLGPIELTHRDCKVHNIGKQPLGSSFGRLQGFTVVHELTRLEIYKWDNAKTKKCHTFFMSMF